MASIWSNHAITEALKGTLDLDVSTGKKLMLLKSTYTPNQDHDFVNDISAHECDATNYTGGFNGAGRKAITGQSVTKDDANNKAVLDATDPATWTSLGGASNNTLRYAAYIKEVTTDADSLVICILDFGSNYTTNGGDFTVQFNASGIGAITT